MGFSRQAYYQNTTDNEDKDNLVLAELQKKVNAQRKDCPTRGCRAMYERFGDSIAYGRDKCIKMMMQSGFRVKYPKRYGRATQSGTREFPNLLVNKTVTGINQVWQADMAHYQYGDRKYYDIYITDVYSQEIVGYGAFSSNIALNYAQVLSNAIRSQSKFTGSLEGLIHHSDGGKQYESIYYKDLCSQYNIQQSMCMYSYENPYAEKTNDLIHNGYLNTWRPKNLQQLRKCQKKAVLDHNHNSKKKKLGNLSPLKFKSVILNNQLCPNAYHLMLKPTNPVQPRERIN